MGNQVGQVRVLQPQEVLFREGDPGGGLYLVKEGQIEVYREAPVKGGGDSLVVPLALVKAGEFLGTATLLSKEPRLASARALDTCTIQIFDAKALEQSLEAIPTWVKAVFKDTLARLKQVDERLVDSAVQGQVAQKTAVPPPLGAAGQFVFFLHALWSYGTLTFEERTLFPLRDVPVRGEWVFRWPESYFSKVLDAFVRGGLYKTESVSRFGPCVLAPQGAVLEDFGHFLLRAEKEQMRGFVSVKHSPWLGALVRCARRRSPPTGGGEPSLWSEGELRAALAQERGREVPERLFKDLCEVGVLQAASPPGGGVSHWEYVPQHVQKRLVFEATARLLSEIEPRGS